MAPPEIDLAELEFAIGNAPRGRGRKSELRLELVRALGAEDLPALVAPPAHGMTASPLQSLRHSHHQAAQLIAKGTEVGEVALLTGYSPSTLYRLKGDPAFAELIEHYASERQRVLVDVLERMKALGLSTLDELQERLESDPAGWTKGELMQLTELLLVKGGRGVGAATYGGGAGAPTAISINFVQADPGPTLVIDGEKMK